MEVELDAEEMTGVVDLLIGPVHLPDPVDEDENDNETQNSLVPVVEEHDKEGQQEWEVLAVVQTLPVIDLGRRLGLVEESLSYMFYGGQRREIGAVVREREFDACWCSVVGGLEVWEVRGLVPDVGEEVSGFVVRCGGVGLKRRSLSSWNGRFQQKLRKATAAMLADCIMHTKTCRRWMKIPFSSYCSELACCSDVFFRQVSSALGTVPGVIRSRIEGADVRQSSGIGMLSVTELDVLSMPVGARPSENTGERKR
ncbi:hypothetical protein BKA70DRAFT_1405438 [Coprinopsis sp. MPI-PUGE-AT-0042]|nr:hypothetical protein BKA70DRAFT_1405438 [Coprinopsis sp. MPI-PUGE-AT-0042]